MKQSKFTISSRREKILNYLREHGSAKVDELSELCQVSPLTVRRDLDSLVQIDAVRRSFGGAQLVHAEDRPATFEEKETVFHREKEKIAAEVSRHIPDGATVFMNSGTTVLQVMKALRNKNVTIITNNALGYQCAKNMSGDIICTGGMYSDMTKAYLGDFAVNIVSKIYADVCILGVNGINAANGITTSVLQETNISNKMVERCIGKVIVVADGSKIGKTFNFVSVKLSHINLLITDSSANPYAIEKLRNTGLEIIILD